MGFWDPVSGRRAASRCSGDHSATLGADGHSYMESSEVLGRMRSNFQFGQWLSVTVIGDLFFSNWVLLESKRVLLSSEGSQEAGK